MSEALLVVAVVSFGYVLGSLPAHRVVERRWSVELHRSGTGNSGAGNATRSAGIMAGVVLAVLDGLKGLVPVVLARLLGAGAGVQAAAGVAAVAGNDWPVWRAERGGRGLATSVGVVAGFNPALLIWPAVWSMAGWFIGGGLGGFVGWGGLPGYAAITGVSSVTFALTVGLAAAAIVRRAQGNAGFQWSGLGRRIVLDRDPRPTVHPRRWLRSGGAAAWAFGLLVLAFPLYLWLARSLATGLVLDVTVALVLVAAVVTEFAAKWAFGELFRDGVDQRGISRREAFRAALVGTGVARIIPAGGAITPAAMAWSVKGSGKQVAGAALRAAVLNYGGLAFATGTALVWVAVRFPEVPARRSAAVLGIILVVVGVAVLGLSTRLRAVRRLVPRRFRRRLDEVLVDHRLTRRAVALLTARVLLEATTLGLTLIAFGIELSPSRVVTSFGVAQLVGGLPGTPGGLGVTELGLVGTLGYFGVSVARGAGPVLAFRLLSYWLPAIAGVVAGGASFLANRRAAEE